MERTELKRLLPITCHKNYKNALLFCKKDFFDNEDSCCWYHSVWQYLRLVDKVSSPYWHKDFYYQAIGNLLSLAKREYKILICGTADYTMFDLAINAFATLSKEPIFVTIYVVDKCRTPIKICGEYLELRRPTFDSFSKSYNNNYDVYFFSLNNVGFTGILRNEDLFKLKQDINYDAIITDAFLTRFDDQHCLSVLDRWNQLLVHGGRVITTVRVHNSQEYNEGIFKESTLVDTFVDETIREFSAKQHLIEGEKLSINQLRFLAEQYAIRMVSNNLGEKEDIINKFRQFFVVSVNENFKNKRGELKETSYLGIEAIKRDENSWNT